MRGKMVKALMSLKNKYFKAYMKIMSKSKVAKEISTGFTKGTLLMGREKDMELFNGIMAKNLRVIGKTV